MWIYIGCIRYIFDIYIYVQLKMSNFNAWYINNQLSGWKKQHGYTSHSIFICWKAAVGCKRSTNGEGIWRQSWHVWPYLAFLGSYPSTTRPYLIYISTYLCTVFYTLCISVARLGIQLVVADIPVFKVEYIWSSQTMSMFGYGYGDMNVHIGAVYMWNKRTNEQWTNLLELWISHVPTQPNGQSG